MSSANNCVAVCSWSSSILKPHTTSAKCGGLYFENGALSEGQQTHLKGIQYADGIKQYKAARRNKIANRYDEDNGSGSARFS